MDANNEKSAATTLNGTPEDPKDPGSKETSVRVVEGQKSADDEDPDPFSEGGLDGWMTIAGVWLIQFSTFGYTNAHGVYTDFYVREYLTQYTSSEISWIGSVQFMLTLSAGIITGRAFDAGYFRHMTILGAFLLVFCLFMLSLAKPHQFYQIFLSQGIGLGLAIGLTYVPSMGIIPHYFHKRRAFAMGVATSGSAIGGVIHPIVINNLISGSLGFSGAVKVSAGMNAVILFVAILLMKPRYPKKHEDDRPAGGLWKNVKYFYSDPPYAFTSAGTILVLLGLYFPIFFLQLYAVQHGINPHIAFYFLTMLNGANALGRILPNMLVPVVGPFNVMISTSLGVSVLIFALAGAKDVSGMVVFSLLFGFFSGAYIGLLGPLLSSLALKHSEIGARMGIGLSLTGFAALVGSPIAGALLGPDFKWIKPIIFAGVCVAFGAVSFAIARLFLSRRKGTWRI